MFRRSALEKTGSMNDTLEAGGDNDLFIKLCYHFRGTFLPTCLTRIRKHPQNISADHLIGYTETITLIQNFYREGYLSGSLYRFAVSKLYYKMGLLLLGQRQYGPSLASFWKYVALRSFHWKGWARLMQLSLLRIVR